MTTMPAGAPPPAGPEPASSALPAPPADGPPVPVLCGPTAAGKSAAAMAVAARLPIEIVSVDSAQVYRGMDIGTAKPTAAERRAVPHHLIDVADPTEPYSAARFAREAAAAIAAIRARGKVALLAGGTMLYLRALAGGLDDLPPADAALRARLDDEARTQGWPALHARLARLDPDTARRLDPTDAQRIQRALEVCELAGEPMSALLARAQARRAAGEPAGGLPLALVSLEPSDRTVLHARIARRFDAMLAAGLVDEVRALRARGDLDPSLPSMRCVGYRQAWEHLDGRYDLHGLRERAVAATRQLARRQLTWLRALPQRIVVDACAADAAQQAARHVERIVIDGDRPDR